MQTVGRIRKLFHVKSSGAYTLHWVLEDSFNTILCIETLAG